MNWVKSDLRIKKNIINISNNILKRVLIIFAILAICLTLIGNYNTSFARSRKKKIKKNTMMMMKCGKKQNQN